MRGDYRVAGLDNVAKRYRGKTILTDPYLAPVAGPFGFEANKLPGYTKLEAGRSFCVDDPASLLYGKIVSQKLAATQAKLPVAR